MVASIARRTCLLVLTTGVLAASLPALAQPDWVTALRGGGYVLIMRHGATHQDQADTDLPNLANVAKQRQLRRASDDGRRQRGRDLDPQARRRRRLPAGGAGAGRRVGQARQIGKRKRSQPLRAAE